MSPRVRVSQNVNVEHVGNGAPGDPPRRGTPDLLVSAAGGLYPVELPVSEARRIRFNSSRPWPDFNCFSLRMASARVANVSSYTSNQAPRFFVDFVIPELCWPSRCVRSDVKPV